MQRAEFPGLELSKTISEEFAVEVKERAVLGDLIAILMSVRVEVASALTLPSW